MVKRVVANFVNDPAWSKFVIFNNKLKFIKVRIRSWNAEAKLVAHLSSSQLVGRLVEIDKFIDDGQSSDDIIRERREILRDLANLEKTRSINVAQKVRSIWAVEGDENSAFFHALLKKC